MGSPGSNQLSPLRLSSRVKLVKAPAAISNWRRGQAVRPLQSLGVTLASGVGHVMFWFLLFLSLIITVSSGGSFHEDYLDQPRTTCYSCANFAYLTIWHKLMHHYFPPKNFTDECFNPGSSSQRIETVPCSSACFTLVERIDQFDYPTPADYSGVLRGCVDRLLLFGVDDDVRNVLASHTSTRVCRETERKLLRLYPLSTDTPYVTFCSCTGERCNDQEMLSSSFSNGYFFAMAWLLLHFVVL